MTIEDIALTMMPGIGVKGAVHLIEIFGDARSIFAASADQLIQEAELRADLAQIITKRKAFSGAEREMDYCYKHGITPLASTDDLYPQLLRETPDYPHVLYIRGNPDVLSNKCISFVGTRTATPYGQTITNRLIEGLAERLSDLCIVSGLAFGIDAAAHRAAIAAGVPTIGVLANVLPDVSPTQHAAIARDMVQKGGALVTEINSQDKQNGNFYLARNRIIAALSSGTVVVESADSGGSLYTAQCADGYNRTVMAVPGRTTDRASSGTNNLIRNRKAQLVMTANDIIEELRWELGAEQYELRARPSTTNLTTSEAQLLGCFGDQDTLSLEQLVSLSGHDPGTLATLLIGLELAGALRQLPGNIYMKLL